MLNENLTPEQIQALAKDQGAELTDDQLEQIAAGGSWVKKRVICPKCGRTCEVSVDATHYVCPKCGQKIK